MCFTGIEVLRPGEQDTPKLLQKNHKLWSMILNPSETS